MTKGVSICDTFRFEKVNFSPRQVVNAFISKNTIEVEDATNLMVSVEGTPWVDYYVRSCADEYARIALVDINKRNKKEEKPYLIEKPFGKGRFILSQIEMNAEYEKNIRIYAPCVLVEFAQNLLKMLRIFRITDEDNKGEKDAYLYPKATDAQCI